MKRCFWVVLFSVSLLASGSTPSKFEWIKEPGIRVEDGSVPYICKLKGGRFRLYYCGPGGILSAISSDGLNFEREPGVRIASQGPFGSDEAMVCDPSVVDLGDGRIRMYYKGANGPGGPGRGIHKVFSAVSSNGLDFRKEGLRIDSEKTDDRGWASVPEAIRLEGGKTRIYYVSGALESRGGIASAISEDGLNFKAETGSRIQGLVDPAITILPDGGYLLLVVSLDPRLSPYLARGIYSFTSEDGLTFTNQEVVLQDEGVFDPSIVQVSENTYRVYYGKDIGGQPDRPGVPRRPNIVTQSILGHLR